MKLRLKPYYSIKELAKRFCVSEKTILREIHDGQFGNIMILRGKQRGIYRIPAKNVRDYERRHTYDARG